MSIYNTYLSNLDSLVFDTPNEIVQTDKDIAEELDLWVKLQHFPLFFYNDNNE